MPDIFDIDLPALESVDKKRSIFAKKVLRRLHTIEEDIINDRDDGVLLADGTKYHPPVYTIKGRMKATNSTFLKTKRKMRCELNAIKDYAGLRILVLFDEHLMEMIDYMLKYVINSKELEEILLFNFDDEFVGKVRNMDCLLNIHVKNGFSLDPKDKMFRTINRKSGYQSIHFLFKKRIDNAGNFYEGTDSSYGPIVGDEFFIEVQLRTLLQDVWSEMEHKLAYKQGKSNPYIATSFNLLQEDISTMGHRLSDILELRNRHLALDQLAIHESRPHAYFRYEDDWEPTNILKLKASEQNSAQEFNAWADKFIKNSISVGEFAKQAGPLLTTLSRAYLEAAGGDEDLIHKVKYWQLMEKGYIHCLRREYGAARQVYQEVVRQDYYREQPVPLFRLAELMLVQAKGLDENDLVPCLIEFDKVIALIGTLIKRGDYTDVLRTNAANILTKIAAIYDLLGSDEYLDYCISLFEKAKELLDQIKTPNEHMKISSVNNLGWVYLEKFRISPCDQKAIWHKKCIITLKEIFPKVREAARDDPDRIAGNSSDTFSWLFYQTYWHIAHPDFGEDCISDEIYEFCGKDEMLAKAREFCAYIWRGKNSGVFVASSISRQRSRSEQIMNPKQLFDREDR
ncbi:MAG: RelA/SpoT domain-containing protein [Magnetococcus sp. YQC-5]